jgi:DUF1009 family protein
MSKVLGIIAGGGEAPKRLIDACQRHGRMFHVLALEGQTDPDIGGEDVPVTWLPLGAVAAARDLAKEKGVEEVVMLGRVRRPTLTELKPDWLLLQKLPRIGLAALGDDGLLKAIVREFEAEGFTIIAPHTVFAELLMPEGQLGRHAPDEQALMDIRRATEIVRTLGQLDIGQAAIVQQGIVLGVEAIEGTDALIRRSAHLRREGDGGVLVKMKKPQQDTRFDLPSIGTSTVREAIAAGLKGIAAEAGASLLVDREAVIAEADRAGLFILGINDHG